MQWLKSALFMVFFVGSATVTAILVTLRFWLPAERNFAFVRSWARLVMAALKSLCNLDYIVDGADNIPPQTVVVLQKHSSAWETIAGIIYFPTHTWVLKRELMWIPILGWALAVLRAVPINRKGRSRAVQQVIEHGSERLEHGMNVMIYPEGTRVEVGQNGRFGRSGALLATRSGHPVVPIAHNAGEFWPRRSLIKRPGVIRVCIGPPIDTAGKTSDQVNAEARAWMDTTMARISPAHAAHGGAGTDTTASAG